MARSVQTTLAWPVALTSDDDGRIQVRFPDFPEALTDGADEAEALAEAADCLAEAVAARITDQEDLPAPSPLRRGLHAIPLAPLLAYKAALFSAMRRDGLSESELARRLGLDEEDVRRLIDPSDRASKIERLHAAGRMRNRGADHAGGHGPPRAPAWFGRASPSKHDPTGEGDRNPPRWMKALRQHLEGGQIGPVPTRVET
jgi:antitoxin HicB